MPHISAVARHIRLATSSVPWLTAVSCTQPAAAVSECSVRYVNKHTDIAAAGSVQEMKIVKPSSCSGALDTEHGAV